MTGRGADFEQIASTERDCGQKSGAIEVGQRRTHGDW
jgi:hypothetical protein